MRTVSLLTNSASLFRSKEMCHEEFIAALALISLIAIPSLNQTANAADVSPASPTFGSNGY